MNWVAETKTCWACIKTAHPYDNEIVLFMGASHRRVVTYVGIRREARIRCYELGIIRYDGKGLFKRISQVSPSI